MTSIYLGKMCAHILELLCNGNVVFFFGITQNKEKGPFFHEKLYPFCFKFDGWFYFINMTLDKV